MVTGFEFDGRAVGLGQPCLLVAEVGVNHNGDPKLALQLVDAAADAGVDAVKFQLFAAERVVLPDAPKAAYQKKTTDASESQFSMLKTLELPLETYRLLQSRCLKREVSFMCTPFDEESADYLAECGITTFKVSSGDLTNLPFLAHMARKGIPMIVSTGMATLPEVEAAVCTIRNNGNPPIVLLHCVSNYPTDPADVNLRAMQTLTNKFGVAVGFSDHTPGIEVSLAAVSLGACVVEKHLTLDSGMDGPDHAASIEPSEFSKLVRGVRVIESALGSANKVPAKSEGEIAAVARKSLTAAIDIPVDTLIQDSLIVALRPGTGLSPSMKDEIIGRRANRPIAAGTMLELEMFD